MTTLGCKSSRTMEKHLCPKLGTFALRLILQSYMPQLRTSVEGGITAQV